jgi:hypothetical protein
MAHKSGGKLQIQTEEEKRIKGFLVTKICFNEKFFLEDL